MKLLKNKKAWVRTVEVVIAIMIISTFALLIARSIPDAESKKSLEVLDHLSQDSAFRNCAIAGDVSCMNASVQQVLSVQYRFLFSPPSTSKDVIAEHYILSGNATNYDPTFISLYYWLR